MRNLLPSSLKKFFSRWVPLDKRPWDFPEQMLFRLLSNHKSNIRSAFVVGAYHGSEVRYLLNSCPFEKIYLFEPNPSNVKVLKNNWGKSPVVRINQLALSSSPGLAEFHEMKREGNGSLNPNGGISEIHYKNKLKTKFLVDVTTADIIAAEESCFPDLLWIDVQGHELEVLMGALNILSGVKVVFIEVSIFSPLYSGGVVFSEINQLLSSRGFFLIEMGTDLDVGTGNALYTRKPISDLSSCFTS